jgi:hypothetical protein
MCLVIEITSSLYLVSVPLSPYAQSGFCLTFPICSKWTGFLDLTHRSPQVRLLNYRDVLACRISLSSSRL